METELDQMFKNFQTQLVIDSIGWYGMAAIVGAYFLVSFGFISPLGVLYQALNITGALATGIVSWYKKLIQVVVLEIIFAAIGLVALIKIVL